MGQIVEKRASHEAYLVWFARVFLPTMEACSVLLLALLSTIARVQMSTPPPMSPMIWTNPDEVTSA